MSPTCLYGFLVPAARITLLLMLFGRIAHASADLQLSYDVGPKTSPAAAIEPVTTGRTDFDAPLRLERELLTHIDNMNRTTRELRSIVEAMPGPEIHETAAVQAENFPSAIEETTARLNHVEQLILDIGLIIKAMPVSNEIAHNQATIDETKSQKRPARSGPPPMPAPSQDSPLTITTKRTLLLASGGLAAVALARYLRRRYLRKRPSAKDIAATIEPPPLNDEAIELADVMISMGLADGAAQALVERIKANPRQSLSHWLKLLDVYRKTGQQERFENATEEMRKTFNVKPTGWNDFNGSDTSSISLESYPHIATQLKKLWPSPASAEYLLSLLADNREGKRTGFPLPVIEEIVLLLAVLRSQEEVPA